MKVLVILVSNNYLPDKSVKMNSKKSSKVGMTMGSSVLLRLAEFEFVTVVLLEEEEDDFEERVEVFELGVETALLGLLWLFGWIGFWFPL